MDDTVPAAARALGRGARWDLAVTLLDAHAPDASAVLQLRTDLLCDKAFWTCTPPPEAPPDRSATPAGHPDHAEPDAWSARWALARAGYTRLLQDRLAGRAPDTASAAALRDDLETLRESAPDDAAERAVRFHLGLVLENLLGDPAAATPHWTAAADGSHDDTAASALRHLGGQRADAGDDTGARDLWWRSFRLRAAAGDLPGTLAQLALLAPSTTLAEAVDAWADAAGLAVLRRTAPGGP